MASVDRPQTWSWAKRYAPFLAIVAFQLVLIAQGPTSTTTTVAPTDQVEQGDGAVADATGGAAAAATADQASGTVTGGATVAGATAQAGSTGGATSAAATQQTKTGGTAAGATGAAQTKAAGAAQQVDSMGRPLSGDKSKCAPGGLVQENITYAPAPCMPKFTGDNGGPTYMGVTADTVTVVILYTKYADGVQQGLTAVGLAMTPEQTEESHRIWETFVNSHYEMYGRKIKLVTHVMDCADAACLRAEAKAITAKHKPFAVAFYAFGIMPDTMIDQFSQLGVITVGAPPISDDWYKRQAPFAWSIEPHGTRAADMVSDYYCKKMQGKNATLAGDPTMKVKKRKLGILSSEVPSSIVVAERIKANVSGDMCGTPADGTTIYTYSADPATAQNQGPALVTRMKNDGITTRVGVGMGSQEDDKQQYYPENLFNGLGNGDDDLVGQFFSKLGSPTQAENTFGIGFYPKSSPPDQKEYYRAAKSVNPNYEPPYLAQGGFGNAQFLARLIQWAGPKLTPQTFEAGAKTAPQLGGWTNPNPWQGWKCCNPYVQLWKFGPGVYTAWADAREIYWSGSTVSPSNNAPGSWVCVNDCRRYEVGQWPKGEPKQAS